MNYLFISRKNVHSRYYKMIIKRLKLDAQLYIMGLPKLSSLLYLRQAFLVDFRDIRHEQLLRKKADNPIWDHALLSRVYSLVLMCIERLRYAKCLAVLSEKRPDYVVVWNGRKLPNITIVMAAKTLGIKLFYFENGLLPKTVSLDPKGVNFASSLSSDPNFYLSFDPENDCVFSAPEIVPRSNVPQRQNFDRIVLPERFVFVPFQVPHDTQIVCYSSWIDSMERFYEEAIRAVKTLNDPSLKVVFKEHPSWRKHYTSLYDKDDIALFANGNATTELIEKAEVVLTINSTVGMESLLLNKQVITLGDACYNIDGLVLHANDRQQLADCLNEVYQGWKMDDLLRDKFFSFLKHVYCVPRVTKDDDEHIHAVKQRLTGRDEFSDFERR